MGTDSALGYRQGPALPLWAQFHQATARVANETRQQAFVAAYGISQIESWGTPECARALPR